MQLIHYKEAGIVLKKIWILVWTLPPSSWAASSKSLSFSDPQFTYLWNEAVKVDGLLPTRKVSNLWRRKEQIFLTSCFINSKVRLLEVTSKAALFFPVIECFPGEDMTGSSFPLLLLFPFVQSLKEAYLSQTFIISALPSSFFSFSISLFTLLPPFFLFFISLQLNSILKIFKFRHSGGGLVSRSHFSCLVPSEPCHSN